MTLKDKINDWIAKQMHKLMPRMNDYLIPLVKHYESFFPNWYKCTSGVDTIGFGHTGSMVGLKAAPWTEEYASEILGEELSEKYLQETITALAKCGINFNLFAPHQQAAIVSLCYNNGPGAIWQKSGKPATWVKRWKNNDTRERISEAFYRWNKSGENGKLKTTPGLVRRRFTEMILFWDKTLVFDPPGWRRYYELHK